ncbi:MAG TPA: hypothetical protein VFW44_18890 [Bryobacteraceae bacterium]|nr:hypothetical protein [Bryobacteraceae bacterium]
MTQDQIRELLGRYATDTLTEDERRVLFEASLEDQELFNALQNEDALKELLADPVTRGQLRVALEQRPRRFPWRRWMLGVAVPAAVAFAAVLAMNRANAPKLVAMKQAAPEVAIAPPAAPAPLAVESNPPGPALKARERAVAPKSVPKAASQPAAIPAPAAEVTATLQARAPAAAPAVTMFRAGGFPPPAPEAVREQISGALKKDAPLYQGPLLRYSLVRGRQDDRAVRVEVTTGIAGYVALYEVDGAGNAKRVYPAGEEAVSLLPNIPTQIPANPILVAEGSRLRLVLAQAPVPVNGLLAGAAGAQSNESKTIAPSAPLVVDISVGP